MHMYMYMYIHICVYVCMYTYTYTRDLKNYNQQVCNGDTISNEISFCF